MITLFEVVYKQPASCVSCIVPKVLYVMWLPVRAPQGMYNIYLPRPDTLLHLIQYLSQATNHTAPRILGAIGHLFLHRSRSTVLLISVATCEA
jgi:hypothetical protein